MRLKDGFGHPYLRREEELLSLSDDKCQVGLRYQQMGGPLCNGTYEHQTIWTSRRSPGGSNSLRWLKKAKPKVSWHAFPRRPLSSLCTTAAENSFSADISSFSYEVLDQAYSRQGLTRMNENKRPVC